jgi:hypothetical protein
LAKDRVIIYHGLYGLNAVLTGIALGGRPHGLAGRLRFLLLNWRSTIYALIGTIFSAIVFAAIAVALSPDRHASVDRSVRAHDLAADSQFQSTAAAAQSPKCAPRVDPGGVGSAGSRCPVEGSKLSTTPGQRCTARGC